MRIGISGTPLLGPLAGVGRYTLELVAAMAEAAPDDDFELVINAFRRGRQRFEQVEMPRAGNVHARLIRLPAPLLFAAWRHGLLRLPAYEVYHSKNHILPALHRRTRLVATVHDLSVFDHPEWYVEREGAFYQRELRRISERADRIIAVSDFTRRRLIDVLGVDAARVTTIYQGYTPPIAAEGGATRGDAAVDVERPFLLYVGTIEPRKNVDGLIRAFTLLRQRRADVSPRLVLVGRWGWLFDGVRAELDRCAFRGDIVVKDYLSADEIAAYYRAAAALVYPSLYEGFGRPPLEAMSFGCPVIVARAASLPEVVGDAGLLAEPGNDESLADAMERVLTDEPLRTRMVAMGREQAAKFRWDAVARQVLDVYRRLRGTE